MNKTKELAIEYAKDNLLGIYDKYKDQGILALYLWGTVTRNDFDPETSDIDVICIVDNTFLQELNGQIKDELTTIAPDYEWGFQIIYLDELNAGGVRSRLAEAIPPETILPFFSQWLPLYGKQFSRDDFSSVDASIDDRMKTNIFEIRVRQGKLASDSPERKVRDYKGIVKACLFLIYNRQLKRSAYFDIDYDVLPSKADDIEKPLLNNLLHIKHNELYNEKDFSQYLPAIVVFADKIELELQSQNSSEDKI